jgi:hypothetical protein
VSLHWIIADHTHRTYADDARSSMTAKNEPLAKLLLMVLAWRKEHTYPMPNPAGL